MGIHRTITIESTTYNKVANNNIKVKYNMLNLNKNTVLSGTISIKSQRTYIEVAIEQPLDCVYFLKVYQGTDVIAFNPIVKSDNFGTILSYSKEMADISKKFTASICIVDGKESTESNKIAVVFDRQRIASTESSANMLELIEVQRELAELKKQLSLAFSGRVPKAVPDFNVENCKKGMIPTVISDTGAIAFTYPFADILNEVNGKHSIMRSIELDASDIKLKDEPLNSLDKTVKLLREYSINQMEMIKTMAHSLKVLSIKVASLEATLIDFTNAQ